MILIYAAIPIFIGTMFLEWHLLTHSHRDDVRGYAGKDTAASISMGLGYLGIQAVTKTLFLGVYLALYEHRLLDLEIGVTTWLLLLVAEDFCYYWYHRTHHEVRVLWASHVNHHSSRHYNLSTALRQSWTAPFTGPMFWAVLPLIGFPVEMVIAQQAISLLYQYWIHTELVDGYGPFGWIFNTPSHHRVHHGSNPRYLDRNYAGILIVWDRLFGTFQSEDEPVVYGITHDIETHNPVRIAFHEFAALGRDVARTRSWRARLAYIFGRPGWRESASPEPTRSLTTSPGESNC